VSELRSNAHLHAQRVRCLGRSAADGARHADELVFLRDLNRAIKAARRSAGSHADSARGWPGVTVIVVVAGHCALILVQQPRDHCVLFRRDVGRRVPIGLHLPRQTRHVHHGGVQYRQFHFLSAEQQCACGVGRDGAGGEQATASGRWSGDVKVMSEAKAHTHTHTVAQGRHKRGKERKGRGALLGRRQLVVLSAATADVRDIT
jgi:hypothetical protein